MIRCSSGVLAAPSPRIVALRLANALRRLRSSARSALVGWTRTVWLLRGDARAHSNKDGATRQRSSATSDKAPFPEVERSPSGASDKGDREPRLGRLELLEIRVLRDHREIVCQCGRRDEAVERFGSSLRSTQLGQ